MNPRFLFSNHEYYHNKVFKRLMNEYSRYSNPDVQQIIYFQEKDPESFIEGIFEVLMFDFWQEARLWFRTVGQSNDWRFGLE